MSKKIKQTISNGVMLNAYPDSMGNKLSDTIEILQLPEFKDIFSFFYILPTFLIAIWIGFFYNRLQFK